MKIAVIYNISKAGVINVFGKQNREKYTSNEINGVINALKDKNHQVEAFEGDKYLVEKLEAFMPRVLKGEKPGMVFNLAYGIQGQSRYTHIPSLLEMLGIPNVGSGPLAQSIALDKEMAKIILKQSGIPTPKFKVINKSDDIIKKLNGNIQYPLIVKPKDEAVSFGIAVAHDRKELINAVAKNLEEYQQSVIVEEFLNGRELNVGILGSQNSTKILPVVEIDFGRTKKRYQTNDTKKGDAFHHVCPAKIPKKLAITVSNLALKTFGALKCTDCARIDFRLDKKGRPYVLELNSMPAIHPKGSYFIAAQKAGYDYSEMINNMVDSACIRYFGKNATYNGKLSLKSGKDSALNTITAYLRNSSEKMENRLEKLVNCNSSITNRAGIEEVGNIYANYVKRLGFFMKILPQVDIGDTLLFENYTSNEKADVMLLCHTDTYSTEDLQFQSYFKKGNRIFGTGIAESKGGLVIMEFALRALKHIRRLSSLKIKILLTTDDSLANKYSTHIVQREASLSKRVLCFKPGGICGEVVTKRNGLGIFKAQIEGKRGSVRPDQYLAGVDAVNELVCKIQSWLKLSNPSKDILVHISTIKAETKNIFVADQAFAKVLFRFPDKETGERLEKEIRHIAKRQFISGSRSYLSGGITHPVLSETNAVSSIYGDLKKIAHNMDCPISKSKRYTVSDVNLVPLGIPAIDGLGPLGGDFRTINEFIKAHTLVERASLVANYLFNIQVL